MAKFWLATFGKARPAASRTPLAARTPISAAAPLAGAPGSPLAVEIVEDNGEYAVLFSVVDDPDRPKDVRVPNWLRERLQKLRRVERSRFPFGRCGHRANERRRLDGTLPQLRRARSHHPVRIRSGFDLETARSGRCAKVGVAEQYSIRASASGAGCRVTRDAHRSKGDHLVSPVAIQREGIAETLNPLSR